MTKASPLHSPRAWRNPFVSARGRKFLSYYRPYRRLLAADLACALVVAVITLILPLCARYITTNILEADAQGALGQIYAVGTLMLGLIVLYALCNAFVDYQGHMMGAKMERDLRAELLAHFQRLPFSFYDDQRVGQLMNRLTNDTFALGELYHHGPEDIVLTTLKFFGTFAILLSINVPLTLALFLILPMMAVYAVYFNRHMKAAMRRSRANIGDIYGKPGASLQEVVAAAKWANAHEFIAALPDGYDTDVGQRGVKLSGGQKQRLSIARVFLKNPPVLIFDEATSALDNESERAVQRSLERLAEDRTLLVIAHRLSTVRKADRIVVLTGGGVAEEGTHAALMARGGVYAKLHDTQLRL